jgi:hypothetical protein
MGAPKQLFDVAALQAQARQQGESAAELGDF